MLITRIEPGRNKRYRIYGDNTFLFALYAKELKRYRIEEDAELPDSVISSITEDVIYKRAKERALYLLERGPLTVSMLRSKLRGNDYTDEVIARTIQFLEKYHYLDDGNYIRMYVETYGIKKSKKQMIYELLHKGIDKNQISAYFDEHEYSEQTCLLRQFDKYTRGKDLESPQVRQKVYRYFYGKGFDIALIDSVWKMYLTYCTKKDKI